jgi:hypothetical protein
MVGRFRERLLFLTGLSRSLQSVGTVISWAEIRDAVLAQEKHA